MSSTFTRAGTSPRSLAVVALALTPAALVVAASLIAQAISGPDKETSATIAQCRTIAQMENRLACFDDIADDQPLPAKGGQAVPARPWQVDGK